MFKVLVTLTTSEHNGDFVAMNTVELTFDNLHEADRAYNKIETAYPKHAVYATAVKLY